MEARGGDRERLGADGERQTWLEQVSNVEDKRRRLEKRLLWRAPDMLLPELGKISGKLSPSLVGVEELPKWRHGDYDFLPLQLTFEGNYSGFPAFLSVVERIVPRGTNRGGAALSAETGQRHPVDKFDTLTDAQNSGE